MVASPLFPRYMFVAIDVAVQRWRSIQSTIGVARLVCNGDHPAEVPGVEDPVPTGTWADGADELLDTLPAHEREAVRLRVLEDLEYSDIARALDTTPAAARVRVHRGLHQPRIRVGHLECALARWDHARRGGGG